MIDHNGHVRLAGFSLPTITSDWQTFLFSCIEDGTTQWLSPELLDPESFGLKKIRPTKESDCYALGMVIYEVLSGRTPFAPSGPPIVIRKVLNGERPARPQGEEGALFTDVIWKVVKLCWQTQPCDRASAKVVLLGLEGNTSALKLTSDARGGEETDCDDQSDATANESGAFPLSNPGLILNYACGKVGLTIANTLLGSPHVHPPDSAISMFFLRSISSPRCIPNHPCVCNRCTDYS